MSVRPGAWMVIHCPRHNSFLYGKRASTVNHPHHWNLFGGQIDKGESPKQAVLRELFEETRLRPKPGEIIKLGVTAPSKAGVVASARDLHYYLFLTKKEIVPVLNPEHCDFAWFKLKSPPAKVNRPTEVALNIGYIYKAASLGRGKK